MSHRRCNMKSFDSQGSVSHTIESSNVVSNFSTLERLKCLTNDLSDT